MGVVPPPLPSGEYHMCLWATHLHHGEPPVLVDIMLRSTPKEIDYGSVARHEHVEVRRRANENGMRA